MNSTDDACMVPVKGVDFEADHASSGTDLTSRFPKPSTSAAGEELLACVIAENKFVDAVTDIANEVRFGKSPLIVFADDVNSEFVSSHITSLTTAIDLSS